MLGAGLKLHAVLIIKADPCARQGEVHDISRAVMTPSLGSMLLRTPEGEEPGLRVPAAGSILDQHRNDPFGTAEDCPLGIIWNCRIDMYLSA